MSDTSTQRCPFKIDTTLDQGIACETTDCAAWNDEAGECIVLQACLRAMPFMRGDPKDGNKADFGL